MFSFCCLSYSNCNRHGVLHTFNFHKKFKYSEKFVLQAPSLVILSKDVLLGESKVAAELR